MEHVRWYISGSNDYGRPVLGDRAILLVSLCGFVCSGFIAFCHFTFSCPLFYDASGFFFRLYFLLGLWSFPISFAST